MDRYRDRLGEVLDFDDSFDFDSGAEGKGGDTERSAGMLALVAKDADGQDNIAAFYASDEEEQDSMEAPSQG